MCAAFSTTYPVAPAGFIVTNPSATTASALGVRTCGSGYIGNAHITCDSTTGEFSADGCAGDFVCLTPTNGTETYNITAELNLYAAA